MSLFCAPTTVTWTTYNTPPDVSIPGPTGNSVPNGAGGTVTNQGGGGGLPPKEIILANETNTAVLIASFDGKNDHVRLSVGCSFVKIRVPPTGKIWWKLASAGSQTGSVMVTRDA